jgi:hypothetical protein
MYNDEAQLDANRVGIADSILEVQQGFQRLMDGHMGKVLVRVAE